MKKGPSCDAGAALHVISYLVVGRHVVRVDIHGLDGIPNHPAEAVPGQGDSVHEAGVIWKPLEIVAKTPKQGRLCLTVISVSDDEFHRIGYLHYNFAGLCVCQAESEPVPKANGYCHQPEVNLQGESSSQNAEAEITNQAMS